MKRGRKGIVTRILSSFYAPRTPPPLRSAWMSVLESGQTHDYLHTNTALAAGLPNVIPNNVENRSWRTTPQAIRFGSTPTELRPPAQGCSARATLGSIRPAPNRNAVLACPLTSISGRWPQPRCGCSFARLFPKAGPAGPTLGWRPPTPLA